MPAVAVSIDTPSMRSGNLPVRAMREVPLPMARFWGILIVAAVVAFLLSGVLAGVSLLCSLVGFPSGQLLLAGVAEVLVSFVFLAAGAGALYAVFRAMFRSRDPVTERMVVVISGLICGVCWFYIGANGLVSPEILTLMFGS